MSHQVSFETYLGSAPKNYEKYFVPIIGAPLAADLVEVAAPGQGERVLDVACGTGVVARLAAERVGTAGAVVAIDINPGMLAVARAAAPAKVAIDWQEANAQQLPFLDESFDVALCSLGLPFFPERAAALREMRRVLVPGGRIAFNVPGRHRGCSRSWKRRSPVTPVLTLQRSCAWCSRCMTRARSSVSSMRRASTASLLRGVPECSDSPRRATSSGSTCTAHRLRRRRRNWMTSTGRPCSARSSRRGGR